VQAAVIGPGPATGVAVRLSAGSVSGTGVLDAAGGATVQLFDATEAMTESAAWNHDWRGTSAMIGVSVGETAKRGSGSDDSRRSRLRDPVSDAFLAELVAAEADY
jgi:hypothetical protein